MHPATLPPSKMVPGSPLWSVAPSSLRFRSRPTGTGERWSLSATRSRMARSARESPHIRSSWHGASPGRRCRSGCRCSTPASAATGYWSQARIPPSAQAASRVFTPTSLHKAGVTDVIVLIGINDIGHGAEPPELIAGLTALVDRMREAGVRAFLGTLTPSGGSASPPYTDADAFEDRAALNAWIRGQSSAAVVDFDRALADPLGSEPPAARLRQRRPPTPKSSGPRAHGSRGRSCRLPRKGLQPVTTRPRSESMDVAIAAGREGGAAAGASAGRTR